ncbi:MAG: ParB/RepB/Spo0J family partition protein [Pseudomonadota bacterium]
MDALLPSTSRPRAPAETTSAAPEAAVAVADGTLVDLDVSAIVRSQYQPRRDFDEAALDELAASIRAQGLMQPLVVRPRPGGRFELIAGERRWRAAQLAGLNKVPVLVREVDDRSAGAMALIENIQREDLNPLEEAMAFDRLKTEFGLTQQQIADTVGKSRAAVANLLRLLNLAPPVRELLANGDLEMGHARALLGLEPLDQERAATEVIEKGLSVRQAEALVRRLQVGSPRSAAGATGRPVDADTAVLERELSDKLGAPVTINQNAKGRGELKIRFSSLDELEGVLAHLR